MRSVLLKTILYFLLVFNTSTLSAKPWHSYLEETLFGCLQSDGMSTATLDAFHKLHIQCFNSSFNRCQTTSRDLNSEMSSRLCGKLELAGHTTNKQTVWKISMSQHFGINITFVRFRLRQGKSGRCLYSMVGVSTGGPSILSNNKAMEKGLLLYG